MEAIEPRVLLAADLSGALASLSAGTSVAAGGSVPVVLHVDNLGDAAVKGVTRIQLFLSADGVKSDDDALAFDRKIRGVLSAGDDASLSLPGNIPTSTPAGTYRLIAVLDSDNNQAENDETNNISVSDAFEVTQPDWNLAGTVAKVSTPRGGPQPGGKAKSKAQVVISNSGAASLPKGTKVGVEVYARPAGAEDASQDVLLTTKTANVGKVAGAKTKKVNAKFQFPADLAVGDYRIVAVVDAGQDLAETDEADNTATSGPITLVAGGSHHGGGDDTPGSLFGFVGDTFALTFGSATGAEEDGSFFDNLGGTGGYTYLKVPILNKKAQFTLGFADSGLITGLMLTFKGGRPDTLAGKTITFFEGRGGTSGSAIGAVGGPGGASEQLKGTFTIS